MKFNLQSDFIPKGDQPEAIEALTHGIQKGHKHQTLLGVTGSGKTYTIANVINNLNLPALIISHNKTLAAQLYQEFRDFFPNNAVSYFVSYYDYYQPEAYLPHTDTYIEKEAEINDEIDKLRLGATTNLLTRKDTIVVASVSCIYNIGSPKEYGNFVLEIKQGMKISRQSIIKRLIDLQYQKNNQIFQRGAFRVRGDIIDIYPAYSDEAIRLELTENKVISISVLDYTSGKVKNQHEAIIIYPAKHYLTDPKKNEKTFIQIRKDLKKRLKELKSKGKDLEAYRLKKRVNYDLEMIEEMGYVNGIENYSRYFDGRNKNDPPFTLLDYFHHAYQNNWLMFIDESHMTIPQIHGMYKGDKSRKKTLIEFGFRLPASLDNRPLKFVEFMSRLPHVTYVSATPADWEINLSQKSALRNKNRVHSGIVEQLIRPTGLVDPKIIIRPSDGQILDLAKEIIKRKKRKERVLVTTLTKKTAEDLSAYFNENKYLKHFDEEINQKYIPKVRYLHSDIETLKRSDILAELRSGHYDVIIGINLLREGLDLPEVSLVAIIDADKEGFLRSETSLIQTMGRAARHVHGQVIMYADKVTKSIKKAKKEIERRRGMQLAYNKQHGIIPISISKPIRERLIDEDRDEKDSIYKYLDRNKRIKYQELLDINFEDMIPQDRTRLINKMKKEMKKAAKDLNFELAMEIRDKIQSTKEENK